MKKYIPFYLFCIFFIHQTSAQIDFSATVTGRSVFFQRTSPQGYLDYLWTFGDGQQSYGLFLDTLTHVYDSLKDYNVCLVASLDIGANDTMCKTINLIAANITTGSVSDINPISYFANNFLHVKTQYPKYSLSVCDLQHRLYYRNAIIGESTSIDTENWSRGIYVVSIQVAGVQKRWKVVKE